MMNKFEEKINAQKKLANIFFEMGMDEDVVSCVTGLSKEVTSDIKIKKKTKKEEKPIELKR